MVHLIYHRGIAQLTILVFFVLFKYLIGQRIKLEYWSGGNGRRLGSKGCVFESQNRQLDAFTHFYGH